MSCELRGNPLVTVRMLCQALFQGLFLDTGFLDSCYFSRSRPNYSLRWETVPHPNFVKEMPEIRAYPLNAVNTHILDEIETIFRYFG